MRSKLLVAGLAVTILVLLAAPVVLLQFLDFNRYKPELQEQVRALTGRDLEIAGVIEFALLPNPRLLLHDLSFANPPGTARQAMFTAALVEAEVALLPLLTGQLQVNRLILQDADLALETTAGGRGNWEFGEGASTAASREPGSSVLPDIRKLRFERVHLGFQSHGNGERQVLFVRALEVRMAPAGGALEFSIEGGFNGTVISMDGELGSLRSLLDGEFSTLRVSRGTNTLSGKVKLQLAAERPSLQADLAFATLDTRAVAMESIGKVDAVSTKGQRMFPSAAPNLEGLRGFDFQVAVKGKHLLATNLSLKNIDVLAKLEHGKLEVSPLQAELGAGQLKGRLEADFSRSVMDTRVVLHGADLNLGKMLEESGDSNQLSGVPIQLTLEVRGRGRSVAAMAADLSGTLLLDAGPGTIHNQQLDLAGGDLLLQLFAALNPHARSDPRTSLRCAVANLRFDQGIARFDRMVAIETDKMNVISSGEINLRDETVDIGLAPRPRKDAAGIGVGAGDLVSVARVVGPLRQPELGLDAAGTAKAGLKVYGALATGGVSLLIGSLVEKHLADPDPCATARAGPVQEEKPSTMDRIKSGFRKLLDF